NVKQAFENLDELHEFDTELNQSVDPEQQSLYEKAFFTFQNTTVEVELKSDIIIWTNLNGEMGSKGEATRPGSYKSHQKMKHSSYSLSLHNVYAVTP
ncbi:unnamed protein product, partial [Didymodactylos carnosus]